MPHRLVRLFSTENSQFTWLNYRKLFCKVVDTHRKFYKSKYYKPSKISHNHCIVYVNNFGFLLACNSSCGFLNINSPIHSQDMCWGRHIFQGPKKTRHMHFTLSIAYDSDARRRNHPKLISTLSINTVETVSWCAPYLRISKIEFQVEQLCPLDFVSSCSMLNHARLWTKTNDVLLLQGKIHLHDENRL
eukprot:g16429.t1